MANIAETPTFDTSVYQIETTDKVLGGPDGKINLQAKQLANRTAWLKQEVETAGALAADADAKADQALGQIADVEEAAGSAAASAAAALQYKDDALAAKALAEQAQASAEADAAAAAAAATGAAADRVLAGQKAAEAQASATTALNANQFVQQSKDAAVAAKDAAVVARNEAENFAEMADADRIAAQAAATAAEAAAAAADADRIAAEAAKDALFNDLASTAAGKGAALVGFKQAGAGAVAMTAQDKLREIVSVGDFGAVASNSSILSALSEAETGGDVLLTRSAQVSRVPTMADIVAKMRAGNVVKIACYGDSTTDGNSTTGWTGNPTSGGIPVGTTDHESRAPNAWPARLKSILRDMFSNNNIQVWNAGYSGQRMDNGWALNNYDIAVTNNPAYGTPDICFIGFGLNDITATNVYAAHVRQTLALCIKLIQAGTLPVLLTCDAIQRNDPSVRDSEEATQEIDSAKRHVARQLNIPLLDAGAALRQWASNNSSGYKWATLQSDNLHFGDLGHSFKAGFIASQMYPDLIVVKDNLEVTAQDPRWQLNSLLTWGTYTTSGPKSGRNYFATAAGGTELMRGWVWNDLANVDLHALTIAGGGTQNQPPRAYYELLDTVSNSTRTVELSGVTQVGTERTSDAPLTMQRIPVGLSRLRSLVKTGAVSGSSYSSDLLFLNTGKEHSTLHNLRLPSSVVGLFSSAGNGVIKFYAPEIYRHDYPPGSNVRIEVNVDMPVQTGILLWHSRCFFYDGARQGGKTRMGLSLFRSSTTLYLTIASGNPEGTFQYTFTSLGSVAMSSVTANADGTYSFLCDIAWSSGIPSINVRLLNGTSLINVSLNGRDVPFSGPIGGLIQRTDSASLPIIKSMTWGAL